MIDAFLESWEFFANAYLAGWLSALFLSIIGVVVVARNQIFLGLAVSQASTFGIACALFLGARFGVEWFEHGGLGTLSLLFAILAALVSEWTRGRQGSLQAIEGWIFLAGSALSILLVSHSPHGMEEVQKLLFSSIIGATWSDVLWFAGTLVVVSGFCFPFRSRLILFVMDRETAEMLGLRPGLWGVLTAILLGTAIGFSLRVTGMLFTFGCLVLPGLIAKNLCRETRTLFLVAPAVAFGTVTLAYGLANYYDYPPGPMAVALLVGGEVLALLLRRRRRPGDHLGPPT